MKEEFRCIEFKEILPISLVYYFDYSTKPTIIKGEKIPLMKNIIVEIRDKYYYLESLSGKKYYIFDVSLRTSIEIDDLETRRDLKLRIKQLLSKEFHFGNLFKDEIVIVNII